MIASTILILTLAFLALLLLTVLTEALAGLVSQQSCRQADDCLVPGLAEQKSLLAAAAVTRVQFIDENSLLYFLEGESSAGLFEFETDSGQQQRECRRENPRLCDIHFAASNDSHYYREMSMDAKSNVSHIARSGQPLDCVSRAGANPVATESLQQARSHPDGSVYFLRPRDDNAEPSFWQEFLDTLLFPFSLVLALVSRCRELFRLLARPGSLARMRRGEARGAGSASVADLIRRDSEGGERVVARSVISYDISPAGAVVHTDGEGIFHCGKAGREPGTDEPHQRLLIRART